MRIQLTLRPVQDCLISINYQYPLSSAIYSILKSASPEYSRFLHDRGYIGTDGKLRKLYTFSFLSFHSSARLQNGYFHIQKNTIARLMVSSPMLEDFIQNFVIGLFSQQKMEIISFHHRASFLVDRVEALQEPEFREEMRFRLLSPMILATQVDTDDGLQTYYYRPLDEGISDAVRQSLIKKHETIHSVSPRFSEIRFEVDRAYIERKGGQGCVSKLITLREGSREETRVKGFLAPFTLKGSIELIRTAWDCGIGDKCSMGFGCINVCK